MEETEELEAQDWVERVVEIEGKFSRASDRPKETDWSSGGSDNEEQRPLLA